MKKLRLLNNAPTDLNEKNDLLGTLEKAKIIRFFLEEYCSELGGIEQNKILALFGEWGSGKSSLVKYLCKNLNKKKYKTIFFEAWHHEKDDNLALSLVDALKDNIDDKESEVFKTLMFQGFNVLKGFTKGISFESPFSQLLGGIKFSPKKTIESIEADVKNFINKKKSFYASDKDFKDAYIAVEDLILGESKAEKIIVFVDDLDRCEPENVLNLLSAIKLFFTYGENTIFLCAVDKQAVEKAIRTKYDDVVKSEEYLEKIFDISWGMPDNMYTLHIVHEFFPKQETVNDTTEMVAKMFSALGFTNARHIKKVLNKYELLRSYKGITSLRYSVLLPELIMRDGSGKKIDTLLALLFIILNEFYPQELDVIFNHDIKVNEMVGILDDLQSKNHLNSYSRSQDYQKIKISQLFNQKVDNNPNNTGFSKIKALVFFTSMPQKKFACSFLAASEKEYLKNFPPKENDILYLFIKFLLENYDVFANVNDSSEYVVSSYYQMCKDLL